MTSNSKSVLAPVLSSLLLLSACSGQDSAPEADMAEDATPQSAPDAPAPVFTETLPSDPAQREFDRLLKQAEMGDSNAQARIAWMYHTGEGVEKNDAMAFEWMKKAADKGDSVAQNNLGVYYRDGVGTAADPAAAAEWFKKSALQGNAQGQGNLGQALITGAGVERNNYLGYVWSGIAAKSADAEFAKKNLVQVGGALKPDERAKADQAIADWRPGREPSGP